MAAKKPVVAFDLSSNPELVKDGENGYLVEQESTDVSQNIIIYFMAAQRKNAAASNKW